MFLYEEINCVGYKGILKFPQVMRLFCILAFPCVEKTMIEEVIMVISEEENASRLSIRDDRIG